MQLRIEQHRSQLEKDDALCDELGKELADIALVWLLHNPAVTAPIVGPHTTGLVLKEPDFDRDGNLRFRDVSGRRVLRVTPDQRLSLG